MTNHDSHDPFLAGYYSNVGEELQRGVDPNVMAEIGFDDLLTQNLRGVGGTAVEAVIDPTPEDIFIAKGFTWVPHQKSEVTLAVKGLEHEIEQKDIYGG